MGRDAGFTLLEILLVLVLMSLASVAVIATLPVNAEDNAKKQAQSLYHRVSLLNEESMLSGKDFGLYINEKTSLLRFMVLDAEGWKKLDDRQINPELQLASNLALQLDLGGDVWNDKQRLFKPGSLFDEQMFAEQDESQRLPDPQIFIMSSGEVTPFSLAIYPQQGNSEQDAWHVVAKENGQLLLLAPGEADEAN
ncbi:type II secretion system protein GspH [Vibrio sp. JPW-9-11-11]|uniref:type II secretion system minor pseudopilin GspH n=1 Tax=Vibrio sp. JPW-9-11-11 TaxID=1416532 RepID=UPI001594472C|nr:type II secretion system minor pseudopilin GspH [Vibrio sp. JPW-9-11-11]NVD05326.1 type II secretion system protein GspH [Vibrio sp. JPW-9-11-11]